MFQLLLVSALAAAAPMITPARSAPTADIVVSAQWLRSHIDDPNLVVLDLSMPGMDSIDFYKAGHIPGARSLDFHSLFSSGGVGTNQRTMQVLPVDSLKRVFETLGVSDGSTIVLYSASGSVSPVARAFVTLDYLGLGARTHILNGGFDTWKAAGGPVQTTTPRITPTTLHVTPHTAAIVNGAYVLAHIKDDNVSIVDARAPEFYTGAEPGHGSVRTGHIPGAHNVYFLALADSVTGAYLTPAEARARFEAAGVALTKPVIVYCHIGQTASVDYLQLRRLGVPVSLYDGSFEGWSRHEDYPVTLGSNP
jgi:thiosulfate/3-mercaptopyruvate sulfurtransferase